MPDNASAGATPAAVDATSTQTTTVSPSTAATSAPPATGEPELGEAGKRAIEAERQTARDALRRATEAEKALEALQSASATDAEKAIKAAKAEGLAAGHAQIRRSEVKAALAGAGINASVLDLALGAPEFANLKVNADGEVEDLSKAIEAFKKARADLFKPPATLGTADGGIRGTAPTDKVNMNDLIRGAARG